MIKIATWNVNSVRARLEVVLAWTREAVPDILLLQELKCEASAFPALEFEELGGVKVEKAFSNCLYCFNFV